MNLVLSFKNGFSTTLFSNIAPILEAIRDAIRIKFPSRLISDKRLFVI